MTNLEKLKAWQEKGIADDLMDVKLTDIPGWGFASFYCCKDY